MTIKPMVERAKEFACKAHEGQRRKGTNLPYIVHPSEVAEILEKAGCKPEVICAGWLHDTVEDTPVTLEILGQEFGSYVTELVAWCTEDKRGTWEERKQHTIQLLGSKELPLDAMMVLYADKLANLRSIHKDYQEIGDKLWERFRRPKGYQSWYYGAIKEKMAAIGDTYLYEEYVNLYQQVFGSNESVCKEQA